MLGVARGMVSGEGLRGAVGAVNARCMVWVLVIIRTCSLCEDLSSYTCIRWTCLFY